jgi:hypothetical protein
LDIFATGRGKTARRLTSIARPALWQIIAFEPQAAPPAPVASLFVVWWWINHLPDRRAV